MAYTPILIIKKRCSPFASNAGAAARIIKDLQGRSGKIKVAECDGIVLDAEALTISPSEGEKITGKEED